MVTISPAGAADSLVGADASVSGAAASFAGVAAPPQAATNNEMLVIKNNA
jgi:hypothetical protein